jgi:hypothetical protein
VTASTAGGGGTTVSRSTKERAGERERGVKKLLSVARENVGPKILGRGT